MLFLKKQKPLMFKKIFLDIWKKNQSYTAVYYNIILQDYPVFPVPNLLVTRIINDLQAYKQSTFFVKDIIKRYKKNFDNYKLFLQHLSELYSLNKYAYIKLKIVSSTNFEAQISDFDDKFDCYLEVSSELIKTSFSNSTQLFVAIQHEIIHWLQVVLNFSHKTYHGILKQLYADDFIHNDFYNFLIQFFVNKDSHISYLFQPKQFEAFCSNACEYLVKYYYQYYNNISKQQFF